MAAAGVEPAIGAKDNLPDITVTVVQKVQTKLGYTEIHTPAPDPDKVRKQQGVVAQKRI